MSDKITVDASYGGGDVIHGSSCCCREEHLTAREVEVIALIAAGLSNEQIGQRLRLSSHTVAAYVVSAMRRLDAMNRAELVARCYVAGVLDQDIWPPALSGHRCIRQPDRGGRGHTPVPAQASPT
jgi:DNA-binding CsgD family transcriptional regulator